MSAASYQEAVGYLFTVINSGLTDHDRMAVLMFVVVQNPEAARAALEAFRDCGGQQLTTDERASVLEDALKPARPALALIRAFAQAALRRAARRAGNGRCR